MRFVAFYTNFLFWLLLTDNQDLDKTPVGEVIKEFAIDRER